jgi:hypothetical protein
MESNEWPGITSIAKKDKVTLPRYVDNAAYSKMSGYATHIIIESNSAFLCFQKCLTVQSYCIFSSVRNKSQ